MGLGQLPLFGFGRASLDQVLVFVNSDDLAHERRRLSQSLAGDRLMPTLGWGVGDGLPVVDGESSHLPDTPWDCHRTADQLIPPGSTPGRFEGIYGGSCLGLD